jgi:hypothetical protein
MSNNKSKNNNYYLISSLPNFAMNFIYALESLTQYLPLGFFRATSSFNFVT